MLKENIKSKLKEIGIPILFFIGGFLIWESAVLIFNLPEFLLPRPSQVILEIFRKFPFFLGHLGITMFSALTGYLIAIFLSFILAVIFVHSKTIEKGLYPYAIAIKIAPILALAPLVVLWFGIGIISKIVIVVLICFFPLLVSTIKGLKMVDENALDLLKSLSANKWQIFLKLRLPSSLPFVFQGLKISATMAMTGAFIGEFLAAEKGIGYLISIHTRLLDTTTAMAALLIMIVAGILFFLLICAIEKKVVFWQKSEGI
jgi:NitT/TauT family transport system permease protein